MLAQPWALPPWRLVNAQQPALTCLQLAGGANSPKATRPTGPELGMEALSRVAQAQASQWMGIRGAPGHRRKEKEESPQSLYSPLPARTTMVKSFFIPRLDLREEKIQVLSRSLPLSCSSGPHRKPHQGCPFRPQLLLPRLCDEHLPPATCHLHLPRKQSPGWQSQEAPGASFLLTLSRNALPAPASRTGSSLSHGCWPLSQSRTNPLSIDTPGSHMT